VVASRAATASPNGGYSNLCLTVRSDGPVMKLDFSEFHPLDHWAGDDRCRSMPGGFRRHLDLWWRYQGPGYHPEDWVEVSPEEWERIRVQGPAEDDA
jgi:hypothetical protein